MKWVIVFVCVLRLGESGTLRCTGDKANCQLTEDTNNGPPKAIANEATKEETEAGEAECLPGSEWQSNCHFCRCASEGVAQCIRQAECGEDFGEPLKCKPNTTFTRGCNACVCLENGLGLCTLENCRRSNIQKKSKLQSGKECAPGSKWETGCNHCWCTPDGLRLCTQRSCTTDEDARGWLCAPDTMWRNDCNVCWCKAEGRAMCTKMGCVTDAQINGTFQDNSAVKASLEPDYEIELDSEDYVTGPATEDLEELVYLENQEQTMLSNPEHPEGAVITVDNHDSNLLQDTHGDIKVTEYDARHNVVKRSVCKPNQIFQSDCNLCNCAADGQSFTCSHNECMEGEMNKEVEVFKEDEGTDHVERHSVCKAHATFYIGCNTCHCNYFGTDYSCTNMPCPLPEDVELFHELKDTALPKTSKNKTQKIVCVANRMFIMDCNTCWCNEDGTSFFCTRRVCAPDDFPEGSSIEAKPEALRIIKKQCRPDEIFELDCNMCRCSADGKSFSCTRRLCFEQKDEIDRNNTSLSRRKRGVAQEPPKTCLPGQEFRMDCNKCLCDNEGQDFSCTRNDCNAQNNNNGGARTKRDTSEQVSMECIPGSVFDKDCNVCRCTIDGLHATCTLKRCSVPNNQNNDVDTPVSEQDPNFRCNPGEQFKRGCNDCSCSADGKSVFCTVRFCDQDITPPPSV